MEVKSEGIWSCPNCKTECIALRYPSGKMKKCMDCQRWYNIGVNSKKVRKNKPSPELLMTEHEFLYWCKTRERRCFYCDIPETKIKEVGLKTQTGRPLSALGIDRLDPERGYEEDNIVFCCFACNKAKGDVFTPEEMQVIGRAIGEAWKRRCNN